MGASVTLSLADLADCLGGPVPSLIATTAPDGTPNVSYLSHVAMIDEQHIGLSNQFFSKTLRNLRSHPRASVLVVDARTGAQYALDVEFVRFLTAGPQFEQLAALVVASSARVGLADTMRLRSVDVFRVSALRAVPFGGGALPVPSARRSASLPDVARVVGALSEQFDADGVVDAALDGLLHDLRMSHTMFLWLDEGRGQLTAIGSRGYEESGIGSDVALGEGVIGAAAATQHAVRINDVSRSVRLSAAVAGLSGSQGPARSIALPGLDHALSQIAVPIPVRGALRGVLFAESAARMAFSADDEAGMALIARQAGAMLALIETMAAGEQAALRSPVPGTAPAAGAAIQVVHYSYDDSVFIDGHYAIKGVAGRLLYYMLEQHRTGGRVEFSNREIRLEALFGLSALKDNLEARLLLLRRRLEERDFPVRLLRAGRGRVLLQLDGRPVLATISGG